MSWRFDVCRPVLVLALAGLLFLPARVAFAAGFAIQEQSGRALGTAFVGEAAAAEDASTIWFNPAGLVRLEGTQAVLGGDLILPSARFENEGSFVNPALGGGRLRGGDGGQGAGIGLVPTGYLAHQLSDRWRIGLGVNVPFGLRTNWNRDWVGRYHAILSELKTVDVAPTVAVRLLDWLSVGAGLDVQYAHAQLTNALDLGGICQLNAPRFGLPPAACTVAGLTPQSTDGFVRIKGDSWAVGYNLGLLFEPASHTRIGVAYRSRIDHTLEGDADFSIPQRAVLLRRLSGALKDTGGRADLNLPDIVRLDVLHEFSRRWALQAGFAWTHWSRFQQLVFEFDNPRQPAVVEPQDWDDSFRAGLAAVFRPFHPLALRAGFAYDFTPVPSAVRRTPRIPDADRVWLAAGVGWQLTSAIALDAGYAHLFAPDVDTRNPDPVTGHVTQGTYSAQANILGAQITWRFR